MGDYGLFLGFESTARATQNKNTGFHITANVGMNHLCLLCRRRPFSSICATGSPGRSAPSHPRSSSEDSPVQELDADEISESLEAVDGSDASTHAQGSNTAAHHLERDHKIPELSTVRPKMGFQVEFASVIEPLSMIRPLPRPPKL